MNEGEVYFALYGENFDPDAVTLLVGLKPSSIQRKNLPTPKHSMWKFSSGKVRDEVIDVYGMANSLVSRLEPHADGIAGARRQFGLNAVLEVVLRIAAKEGASTPAIGFDLEVIEFLTRVGASIDVDTYLIAS